MKILIVDDERISRKILARKMELIGECTAVNNGDNALRQFDRALKKKVPFNLITLDVSMPKMDGMKLLSLIRRKEKLQEISREERVKIIMVSARMNLSVVQECIRLGCDGYITKPVTKNKLIGNLGRMGFEQISELQEDDKTSHDQMVARIIKRFYKGKIKLPVLPRILSQVQQVVEARNAKVKDLVEILKKDIAVSARLISIANSALYKGVEHAETLDAALVRLGMKASCDLISTIVTRDLFTSENRQVNQMLEKLWMHSFSCGAMAKQLGLKLEYQHPDTLFLMGIVHDIGKMLLIKAIADMYPEESFDSEEIQIAIHEIHTTFGAALLKKMKFSQDFIQMAEFHHWNNFSEDDDKALLIIHLSDYLVNRIGFCFFEGEVDQAGDASDKAGTKVQFEGMEELPSFKLLNLDLDKAIEITQSVKSVIESSSDLF